MFNRFTPAIIALAIFLVSCSSPRKEWTQLIPGDIPALLIVEPNTSLSDVLQKNYIPLFDDISTSSLPLISSLHSGLLNNIQARAILMFPNRSNEWQPVFIGEGSGGLLSETASIYARPFTDNHYRFEGITIYRMFKENRIIFGAAMANHVLLSESSIGIEESIRTYLGIKVPMELSTADLAGGELVLNTPYFDHLISQLAAVTYKPAIEGMFQGTRSATIQVSTDSPTQAEERTIHMSGLIPLKENNRSNIIEAVSNKNFTSTLDRHIPSDAAAFGIFNSPASGRLKPGFDPVSRLDSLLTGDPMLYSSIAATIDPEFAFAAFYTSGFSSATENIYIRKLSNKPELLRLLNRLASDDYIIRNNDSYYIRSEMLAVLFGSAFCHYEEFYLADAGDGIILSPRSGLAQRVRGDFNRRRVMHFDDTYTQIRSTMPRELSGFFYVNSENFGRYISHMLAPDNYMQALTSRFNIATLTLRLNSDQNGLEMNLQTHRLDTSVEPYQDLWLYPIDDSELTGKPVYSDLNGNVRDEVLFSTSNGDVIALATDGSVAFQARTGIDIPIGSPIVYDWYANNQKAVIIAAGNKIYAWNNRGVMLPNFPFTLPETITAPIEIADITRNGLPEVVIATADRQIHIMNGRGQNINGWPQNVNATVYNKPVVSLVDGRWSIWATAENAIHSWSTNGTSREHFPWFAESSLTGSPAFLNDVLLTGTADGHVYSISGQGMFSDTLSRVQTSTGVEGEPVATPDFVVQSIQVGGSPVTIAGTMNNMRVRNENGENIRESVFLVQSSNGSVFLYNQEGNLRFVKSTGQPASEDDLPFLSDINSDGWNDLLAVTSHGRLYGWTLNGGDQWNNIPSAGMKFPTVHDLTGDGSKFLIAQTREGLRCWRINL